MKWIIFTQLQFYLTLDFQGLLRLQTQLGDYHQALKAIENVTLDMKTSGILLVK